MSALRRGIVTLALVVIAPITARAADLPVIRIFPPTCEATPVSVDDFIEALRVELAGRQPHCCVVGPGGNTAADAVWVTLSIDPCDPTVEQIGVAVELVGAQRTTQRDVALADLPREARPRALALAVAEMVRSASEPGPADVPLPPPPPPQNVEPPFAIGGGVAGDLQHHFKHGTTLWGARLALWLRSGRWQAIADAGVAVNNSDFDLGSVSILLASAGLFAGPRFVAGPVALGVGPTASVGVARIKGQSNDPDTGAGEGSNVVVTAGVRAVIEGPTGHVLGLFGWLEGGMTLRRLDAQVEGQDAAGISGPYIIVAAGARFGPG